MRAEVHFPNLVFNATEVNFGCILNDTEVMRAGVMTNNSPLPVKYSWFFIKRPPMVRQEPDLLDEGVDMESDYESDEIELIVGDEEEGEREEGGEGGVKGKSTAGSERKPPTSHGSSGVITSGDIGTGEKGSSEKSLLGVTESKATSPFIVIEDASRKADSASGTRSIHVTIDSQAAVLGEDKEGEEGSDAGSGSAASSDPVNSLSSSASLHDDEVVVVESGLPPVSPPPAIVATPPMESRKEKRTGKKKMKKKKPPWELAFDPFKPIPISQVRTTSPFSMHTHTHTHVHAHTYIHTQVFDILPLHGELAPGASTGVHYSFYGHADITAEVIAACKVEGGPTYELKLSGEASRMQYKFDRKILDLGAILYDQVHTTEIVLYNKGKVEFDYATLKCQADPQALGPGDVAILPAQGVIPAKESATFTVMYLPGVPETFSKEFEIRVAHFEADVITLIGEAVYPSMTMSLQRDFSTVSTSVLEEARANLSLTHLHTIQSDESPMATTEQSHLPESVQLEVDRLLVKNCAAENNDKQLNRQSKARPRYACTYIRMYVKH